MSSCQWVWKDGCRMLKESKIDKIVMLSKSNCIKHNYNTKYNISEIWCNVFNAIALDPFLHMMLFIVCHESSIFYKI